MKAFIGRLTRSFLLELPLALLLLLLFAWVLSLVELVEVVGVVREVTQKVPPLLTEG